MKEHPKAIGDRTEAHVLAALVSTYPTVLLPWGENTRYDMFGVYCVENRRVYLVPVADVPTTFAALRIEPTRNGQAAGIRWADAYELHPPE